MSYQTIPHLYHPPADLLSNRIILVTGASSGMGRTLAKSFATFGATVILLARSVKKLEALYDEIETAGYPKPAIYPLNLATATPNDYKDLHGNIESHFGRLDGLVHNAAILGSLTPIEHYPPEQWHQVLQVNLNSAFLLSQATLPLLKQAKDASLIFTTAPEAQQARAYWGAYAISKLGCEGLMQILADELETNTRIRVNCINPGVVKTHLRAQAYPAEDSSTLASPEDLITPYLYLMGADSLGVTGHRFKIDSPPKARVSSYKVSDPIC